MTMKIFTYSDPILRSKAEPVTVLDEKIAQLIDEMAAAMYENDGIGLAAPQVGVPLRVIVADPGDGLISVVNPQIIFRSDEETVLEEGCLSCPGIRIQVTRPENVTVQGIDEKGKEVTIQASGLLSKVLQHEIDHLDGVLILDYISPLKRSLLKSRLRSAEKVKVR